MGNLAFGLLELINYDLGGNNKVEPGKLHAGVLRRDLKILVFKNEYKSHPLTYNFWSTVIYLKRAQNNKNSRLLQIKAAIMFGHSKSSRTTRSSTKNRTPSSPAVPVLFGIMFLLSIAELFFTVDSFQYLQKTHTWHSKTERARLAFLIFSSARMIFLSAVYMGLHCAQKFFHSMFHTVSTPFQSEKCCILGANNKME
jgi:hypothetical protein